VPSFEATSIDRPTRRAITVVNLLERDARGDNNVFHPSSVAQGIVKISIKRLDQDPPTPGGQPGTHERSRVFTGAR